MIVITGPTALGKTRLAARLAANLGEKSSVQIPDRYLKIWISVRVKTCKTILLII